MSDFGVYGIKPGVVLKTKKLIKATRNRTDFSVEDIPLNSVVTVLEIDECFENSYGICCKFWFYHEEKKWYTIVFQNDFYDDWEKIL